MRDPSGSNSAQQTHVNSWWGPFLLLWRADLRIAHDMKLLSNTLNSALCDSQIAAGSFDCNMTLNGKAKNKCRNTNLLGLYAYQCRMSKHKEPKLKVCVDLEQGTGSQPPYGSNAAIKTVWFTGLQDKTRKPSYRWQTRATRKPAKIAPIRRAYNVVAYNIDLSSCV